MTRVSVRILIAWTLAVSALYPMSGCGNDEAEPTRGSRGTSPAVMLSVIGTSPDDRMTYVGAFPEVPKGEVGVDTMVEFGDAYFYTFDGSIFVWEREVATITRYEVTDDYQLVKGNKVSFASHGLKFDGELTFISPSRAYMMVASQGIVVVWDPSTMEVTSTFSVDIPVREGLDTFPIQIGVSAGRVYWAFISMNYDALKLYPKNVVAFAPTDADGPVTVIEDDRCVPSLGGYIVSSADIYLFGGADADVIATYNKTESYPASCVLRVNAGDSAFDADYFLNLKDVTGSPSVVGSWRIDDENILARVWDAADSLPTTIDDYWSAKSFVSKRVNLGTKSSVDFPALPKGGFSSNIQDRVDGATYFSLPRDDGSADAAYRLRPDGIQEAFVIPGGGYWGMGRIR